MGTNYYLTEDVCPCCKRGSERLHIGKSSAGWCFGLHVDPDNGLSSLGAWVQRWSAPNARIMDEYGVEVTPEEMLRIITERQGRPGVWTDRELALNGAVSGPNGLARHAIGRYCSGHGDSTYDLCTGEFS